MTDQSSPIPRPEHPRPDLHRGLQEGDGWLNLNGPWEFAFDDAAVGETDGWQLPGSTAYDRCIRVPFCWESHAAWGTDDLAGNDNWYSPEAYLNPAEVNRDNYREAPRHTVGWYRRTVACPATNADESVWLHIGAADWHVKVWANGQLVGEGDSGYVPFSCDLGDAAQPGDDLTLVIRVEDPQGTEDKPLGKQHKWYTTTSGIWQTAWLEVRPLRHITSLRLIPRLDPAAVVCEAALSPGAAPAGLRVTVTDEDGVCAGVAESADASRPLTVSLGPSVRRWCPEDPHLYTVAVELRDGERVLDTVYSYFGLREVGVAPLYQGGPRYVTLNGHPLYLKGALDQSFTPWGVYTFRSDAEIRRDLEIARETGLNFLRIHIKPEDPRFLYWADRMGMLIMADLPNLGYDGYGEVGNARWEWTFRRVVERDFNHPCIFSWVLFNETWGLGFAQYYEATDRHAWVESMYRLAKALDPTRLVEDNSACSYDHVITDLNTWHYYINDYEQAREHVAHVIAETYPGSGFNYVPGRQQGDEPLMNSEYGGISASMGDLDVSWCFKFNTDLLREQEKCCGYVYTELQDIEWEHNGFVNYDRSPKEFGYAIADLQGPVYLGLSCPPGQTVAPGSTWVPPLFLNRAGYDGPLPELTYTLQGTDTSGEDVCALGSTTIEIAPQVASAPGAVVPLTLAGIRLPDRPCLLRFEARLGDLAANWCYLEVRQGALPEVETLADGRVVLRKLAGDVEVSTAWHEAEVERGVVDLEQHLLGGVEAGHMDYRFVLPQGFDAVGCRSLTVLVEASSKRQGAPQTEGSPWLSDLRVSLNGLPIGEALLRDQYADSRGALSHMHGLRGRYGELVRCRVEGETLRKVLATGGELLLRLEVPRWALNHRGLVVYSSRAGRYPCDVTLVLQ